jgi:CRISPR-associated protein Cas5d
MDLGIMLYDIDYENNKQESMFYHVKMENGVIIVPSRNSEEVLK